MGDSTDYFEHIYINILTYSNTTLHCFAIALVGSPEVGSITGIESISIERTNPRVPMTHIVYQSIMSLTEYILISRSNLGFKKRE